ncbi:unnamed protein product [Heterosigma akashiwo]
MKYFDFNKGQLLRETVLEAELAILDDLTQSYSLGKIDAESYYTRGVQLVGTRRFSIILPDIIGTLKAGPLKADLFKIYQTR